MGLSPLFSESPEMGLSSGAGPIIIICVLALQALESDHLETLQARPNFTAFSHKEHKDGLDSYRFLTIRNTHISKDKSFS